MKKCKCTKDHRYGMILLHRDSEYRYNIIEYDKIIVFPFKHVDDNCVYTLNFFKYYFIEEKELRKQKLERINESSLIIKLSI